MKFFGLNEVLMADVLEDSTTSIGADLEEINADPEETELTVSHPDESADEESDDEEPEESEESEEVEEEEETPEIKDLHPFERPSIKQINESFPELFKKFPSLKDMYFREGEYSRIFPTIDDAKEAYENHEAFGNIREDIFSGDGTKFLSAVKEVDEKKLERFSGSILKSLYKVSPNSFWRAANPLVEDIARNMFAKGEKEKNESLQNAARFLSDYFFGNVEVAEGKKTTVIKEESNSEVNKEREEFDNEKHTAFSATVATSAKSELIKLIDAKDSKTGKSRLDPDDVLSPFIKKTILDRVVTEVGESLQLDKDHIKFMDSLWSKAKKNGRTEEDKNRIITAYLSRAKSLIPSLRSKYVSEALGRKVKDSTQRREKVESVQSRRDGGSQGRGSSGREKNYNPKAINYTKTSDADILNDTITYK